ncbi:MAG TPA: branched-chain amino acid transaminase [Dehalococcoidia bacterium]|nr:branched-chain amino acid transaminase [Dehalococcoidia bacterium]
MEPYAFFRGEYMPLKDAKIGILTQALHYGTATFGGIRANWDEEKEQFCLFRVKDHYRRQLNACKILNISLPWNEQQMADITVETVRRSGFRQNVYCRPLAYKSSEAIGVKLHGLEDDWFVIATTLPPYLGTGGIRCCTSSWRRVSDTQISTHGKVTGIYVNSALAKTDANRAGYDEAIMLNEAGHVSEGSGENIFIVTKGKIVTPPPSDSILLGITRDSVMQLAKKELGIEVIERSIVRSELYVADEAFFTGTATNVAPIIEVDNRPIGSGDTGPITAKLQALFNEVAYGRNPKYSEWYTILKP